MFYSILNQIKQLDIYVLINSLQSLKIFNFKLKDLNQELIVLYLLELNLPTDELLKVIISKTLSDKQISINPKIIRLYN